MYVARRKLYTDNGVVKPGHPVDVSNWTQRTLRAHLNCNFVYEVPDEEWKARQKKAEPTTVSSEKSPEPLKSLSVPAVTVRIHKCEECDRLFKSERGLKVHLSRTGHFA